MNRTRPSGETTEKRLLIYITARGIAFVSAISLMVILCLFFISWQQVRSTPPTDSEAMKLLIEQVKQNPENTALIDDVRRLDVMARQAQFQWFTFARRGGILLAISLISLFGSLR